MGGEDVPEFLAGGYQRQEHHCAVAFAHGGHLGRDLLQIRIQCSSETFGSKVAAAQLHARDVQLQGDGQRLDLAEVPVPDGLRQLVLIGQTVEHFAQVAQVAPVGGGGHAENLGA